MFILREVFTPSDEFRTVHRQYERGVFGVFEMLYKMIDIATNGDFSNDSLLAAYDKVVKMVDIWTTPITIFVRTESQASWLASTYKSRGVKVSRATWETKELKNMIQVVIERPNYSILNLLSSSAKVIK